LLSDLNQYCISGSHLGKMALEFNPESNKFSPFSLNVMPYLAMIGLVSVGFVPDVFSVRFQLAQAFLFFVGVIYFTASCTGKNEIHCTFFGVGTRTHSFNSPG